MKKSVVNKHFTDFASDWIQASYEGGGFEYPTALHRTNVVCDILSELQSPSRVTDLGCGGGHLAARLAETGHFVTGIDQSAEMVQLAEGLANKLDAGTRQRISFRQGELESLKAAEGDQDAVTSMGVIGYLDEDAPIFMAADYLLKPGGLFLLSCRNRLFNMTSISHRTHREIDTGSASPLLNEIVARSTEIPIDRVREFATALIAAGEEILRVTDQPIPEAVTRNQAQSAAPAIEARQHTPDGIQAEANKHGFEMIGLHGVHPHLMQPHMNRLMPAFSYNILSSTLESLHDLSASISWSSVFIAVLRKPD